MSDPSGSSAALPGDAVGGDALRALVAVMDRLRSPGGCPWDAEQTHESLVPYLLEEAHELVEAVETGDRAGLREELGDVLLQVVFHARVAQEDPVDPFDVDDVASDLIDKLVRRHPHVFGPTPASAVADLHVQWDRIKKVEKRRASALDGVPASLGALARAQKLVSRAARAGLPVTVPVVPGTAAVAEPANDDGDGGDIGEGGPAVGERLLAMVMAAHAQGVDAEGELRRATAAWEAHAREVESAGVAPQGPQPRE
ncbi:MazG family protein [Cellulomonas soli]|uniref:NTP pyrophosphohydrolase MazG-like domain-containing protein n=1 Tax=Cellulomonas soli TaxID=931535 RepID=A0A512PG07_9CELL|nr:MazG family protein [Cellulomonas soli]NYI59722.1 XTP/dITP diphosphohydrolase [Cellulomonas soli]GEP70135.1 hypothetical protein CSO01_28500 [Cellulomonas soli]